MAKKQTKRDQFIELFSGPEFWSLPLTERQRLIGEIDPNLSDATDTDMRTASIRYGIPLDGTTEEIDSQTPSIGPRTTPGEDSPLVVDTRRAIREGQAGMGVGETILGGIENIFGNLDTSAFTPPEGQDLQRTIELGQAGMNVGQFVGDNPRPTALTLGILASILSSGSGIPYLSSLFGTSVVGSGTEQLVLNALGDEPDQQSILGSALANTPGLSNIPGVEEPGSFVDTVGRVATETAAGGLLDKLLQLGKPLYRGVGEWISPGSQTKNITGFAREALDANLRLGARASSLIDPHNERRMGTIFNAAEGTQGDIGIRRSLVNASANIDTAAADVTQAVRATTGAPRSTIPLIAETPEIAAVRLADIIQTKTRRSYFSYLRASTDEGNAVSRIGRNMSITGSPVSGPINIAHIRENAAKRLKILTDKNITEGTLVKDLNAIMGLEDIITFDSAWELKKRLGRSAHGNKLYQVIADPDFKPLTELYESVDNAILNDLQHVWNSPEALNHYKESVRISKARLDAFSNNPTSGDPAAIMIQRGNEKVTLKMLDETVDSTELIEAFVRVEGTRGVKSQIAIGDLRAFQFNRMLQNATFIDPATGARRYDPGKLRQLWKEYKGSTAGMMLYGEELTGRVAKSSMDQVIEIMDRRVMEFARAVNAPIVGPSSLLNYRSAASVIQASGGFAAGMGSVAAIAGPATLFGSVITFGQIGRVLSNQRAARIIHATMRGTPLGMSTRRAARILGVALVGAPIDLIFESPDGEQFIVQASLQLDADGQTFYEPILNQDNISGITGADNEGDPQDIQPGLQDIQLDQTIDPDRTNELDQMLPPRSI